MTTDALAELPPRPADVADWEDLLVRMEIMPRALRGTLEEAPMDDPRVAAILSAMLTRERGIGRWLETAATGSPPAPAEGDGEQGDARWLAERFAAVRARNFAMLQRRGVEVWDWVGASEEGGRTTVYRLLSALVRADAQALAALRGVGPC